MWLSGSIPKRWFFILWMEGIWEISGDISSSMMHIDCLGTSMNWWCSGAVSGSISLNTWQPDFWVGLFVFEVSGTLPTLRRFLIWRRLVESFWLPSAQLGFLKPEAVCARFTSSSLSLQHLSYMISISMYWCVYIYIITYKYVYIYNIMNMYISISIYTKMISYFQKH